MRKVLVKELNLEKTYVKLLNIPKERFFREFEDQLEENPKALELRETKAQIGKESVKIYYCGSLTEEAKKFRDKGRSLKEIARQTNPFNDDGKIDRIFASNSPQAKIKRDKLLRDLYGGGTKEDLKSKVVQLEEWTGIVGFQIFRNFEEFGLEAIYLAEDRPEKKTKYSKEFNMARNYTKWRNHEVYYTPLWAL